jgi:hypothetical protein
VTSSIRSGELPAHALLARYRADGAFTDCWVADLPRPVTHADYVEAFYTTPLFGVERRLLAWFASKPSTVAQARLLAAEQLLLCDVTRRTHSWLMVEPLADGAGRRLT